MPIAKRPATVGRGVQSNQQTTAVSRQVSFVVQFQPPFCALPDGNPAVRARI
jgi:hypothetical protein